MTQQFAAIEAGGTKFNLALFSASGELLDQTTLPTTTPDETLNACRDYFLRSSSGSIQGLGIASFGPIELDSASENYGKILNTPKLAWRQVNLVEYFSQALNCRVIVDTDVNAAALAEAAAIPQGKNIAYITVGTGVGVGALVNGHTIKGELHPELGHLPASLEVGSPDGVCPSHGNCIEGVISGSAIGRRWGKKFSELPEDHPAKAECAANLAQLCHTITLAYAPYRIVIGGGVGEKPELLEKVKQIFTQIVGDYLPESSFPEGIQQFLRAPAGGLAPGLYGAFLLASEAKL